jgi:hypothetical protein
MDCFVVLLCCDMDDFPVRVVADRAAADTVAAAVAANPDAFLEESNAAFGRDASMLNCVLIATVAGGKVTGTVLSHSFD